MDSTNKTVDDLFKDVIEFKHSLEFTRPEVEEVKGVNVTSQTAFKTMSKDLTIFQTTLDKHSSKGVYLKNQLRQKNTLIDGNEDVKTET
jgi:hypothetical protein